MVKKRFGLVLMLLNYNKESGKHVIRWNRWRKAAL